MYGYKSGVVAGRGKTSHLTKRRVDSSRGNARLPLLSHLSRIPTVGRSVAFLVPTFSSRKLELSSSFLRPRRFCVSCASRWIYTRTPEKKHSRKRKEPYCHRLWPQGCFPRTKDQPPVPNFSATRYDDPVTSHHNGLARPLLSSSGPVVSCICFEEIEQPDPVDARPSAGTREGNNGRRSFRQKV